jgi:uncharacterized membrane protein
VVPDLLGRRGSEIAGDDERDRAAGDGRRLEGVYGTGSDLSRLLSLSDGVFAFALTFLAVTILLPQVTSGGAMPSLVTYLQKLEPAFVGYLLSFFVVGSWWSSHQRLFSALVRYDTTVVRLNTFFLLVISITPFLVFLLFAYSPNGFGMGSVSNRLAVALYGAIQGAGGLTLLGIWRHAVHDRRLLRRSLPDEWIRTMETTRRFSVAVFAASVAVAFVSPLTAELVWIVVILGFTHGFLRRTPRKDSPDGSPPGDPTGDPPTPADPAHLDGGSGRIDAALPLSRTAPVELPPQGCPTFSPRAAEEPRRSPTSGAEYGPW